MLYINLLIKEMVYGERNEKKSLRTRCMQDLEFMNFSFIFIFLIQLKISKTFAPEYQNGRSVIYVMDINKSA